MPTKPASPCTHPNCGRLAVERGRCADHRRTEAARAYDKQRGGAANRGYGRKWEAARLAFLRAHPLCECVDCKGGELRVMAASVVDHIVPHRGDPALFWNSNNWQAMAKQCHDRKTAREDGGFGNTKQTTR